MQYEDELKEWVERVGSAEPAAEKGSRPTWDEYFAKMVDLISRRSTCLMNREGAVMVKEKRVLTTGYSGAPKGQAHCADQGCVRVVKDGSGTGDLDQSKWPRRCRGLHAIQNTIIQAGLFGIVLRGAVLYTSDVPCLTCSKMLINTEVSEVRVLEPKPDDELLLASCGLLVTSGIKVVFLDDMDIRAEVINAL